MVAFLSLKREAHCAYHSYRKVGFVRVPTSSPALLETEPYRPWVVRHIRYLIHDASEAEGLAQETFILAYRQHETLLDPAALESWHYRIETHTCTDRLLQRERASLPVLRTIWCCNTAGLLIDNSILRRWSRSRRRVLWVSIVSALAILRPMCQALSPDGSQRLRPHF